MACHSYPNWLVLIFHGGQKLVLQSWLLAWKTVRTLQKTFAVPMPRSPNHNTMRAHRSISVDSMLSVEY